MIRARIAILPRPKKYTTQGYNLRWQLSHALPSAGGVVLYICSSYVKAQSILLTSEHIPHIARAVSDTPNFELVWRARYMLAAALMRALRGSRWLSCAHSTRTCQPSGREALRLPSGRAYTSPLHSAVVHGTMPKSPRSLQRSHVAPRRSPSLPSGGAFSSSRAGMALTSLSPRQRNYRPSSQ